ncbi:cytosolic purine 5'-nucleotidase isoform X2 [Hyalella azteca]|uniref:Cytosolic purine 5'-nucleotidase isoform X2 n=1 Tax=Hyalella azteca TaxID=294128 RepID=A0A8B7N0I7_HYAAZ|nr:cytosolic purine 5'-nucleotidase isoform X2 [Hyalella azteca]
MVNETDIMSDYNLCLLQNSAMDLPRSKPREFPHFNRRVFVNRSLNLEKIKYYGFDMDYTLAEYASPEYEQLGFELLQSRLIAIGYPEEIKEFQYDPAFAIRGLWFDRLYGNLLKVDGFGNILICVHGFSFLKPSEIYDLYPNKFIQLDESRIYVMNTLFNLPEIYMIACLVDFFSNSAQYVKSREGVKCGELYMSYKSIFQDIRAAMDWVHMKGSLKTRTVQSMSRYVQRDDRLPLLLDRMKQSGAFIFLLTNSEYWYTKEVMTYLLNFPDANGEVRDWKSYFHTIVVDANKPNFFSDGTIMRQVDTETGALRLGTHTGKFQPGQVYSGGSCDVFTNLVGAKGKDVLYVGDHIFGDILKSKKIRGWRTFLIVPELVRELQVWTDKNHFFSKLQNLDVMLGDLYKNLDSSTNERPDLSKLRSAMREVTHEMDLSYGMMGSLFRSGSRQTHFSNQVSRYADVYASTVLNLLYYPFSYMFRAPAMLMPHESTVTHEQVFKVTDAPLSTMSRAYSVQKETPPLNKIKVLSRANSMVPHARAEAPRHVTHHHDDDADSEDESDEKSS